MADKKLCDMSPYSDQDIAARVRERYANGESRKHYMDGVAPEDDKRRVAHEKALETIRNKKNNKPPGSP